MHRLHCPSVAHAFPEICENRLPHLLWRDPVCAGGFGRDERTDDAEPVREREREIDRPLFISSRPPPCSAFQFGNMKAILGLTTERRLGKKGRLCTLSQEWRDGGMTYQFDSINT